MIKQILTALSTLIVFSFLAISHPVNATKKTKSHPISMKVVKQKLKVNEKAADVYNIVRANGAEGFTGVKGDYFDVNLRNDTNVPVSIHWHGLIVPNDQDGVPYVTQLPIAPGKTKHYRYKLLQAGTFWMHSHYKYYEQQLMTAPFVVIDPNESRQYDREVTVMFQDFTFKNPEKILDGLKHQAKARMQKNDNSLLKKIDITPPKPDLNDVKYDAFLANRHTLEHPQIYKVKAGDKVRLRLINGSSASNFWIYTGELPGIAIAVDGADIKPMNNYQFQIAVAQRIDIIVKIPSKGGAFPILAQVEGTKQQTGVILATEGATIPKLDTIANKAAPALDSAQTTKLRALYPLAKRPVTKTLNFTLTGDMANYIWKINNQVWPLIKPQKIKQGDRVEMVFTNDTDMAHPMHLHGHVFQVTAMSGNDLHNGPLRDTILVLPHTTSKIIFDAYNPGIWMTHCHVLYHMMSGMMTTTNYDEYPEPKYYQDMINGKIKE